MSQKEYVRLLTKENILKQKIYYLQNAIMDDYFTIDAKKVFTNKIIEFENELNNIQLKIIIIKNENNNGI